MNQRNRTKTLLQFRQNPEYYSKEQNRYQCQICGGLFNERDIRVDHKDNDNNNNAWSNLQPLCHPDNIQKDKMSKRKKKTAKIVPINNKDESPQMRVNRLAEPMFREWVMEYIKNQDIETTKDEVIDAACEHLTSTRISLSQSTAERYLRKMTSVVGPLKSYQDDEGTTYIALREKANVTT
jgi:hypothetical protein